MAAAPLSFEAIGKFYESGIADFWRTVHDYHMHVG